MISIHASVLTDAHKSARTNTGQGQPRRGRRCSPDGYRIKVLLWDGSGLVLVWKQLEGGAFRWPAIVDGVLRLTPVEFAALFDGIDFRRVHLRPWPDGYNFPAQGGPGNRRQVTKMSSTVAATHSRPA